MEHDRTYKHKSLKPLLTGPLLPSCLRVKLKGIIFEDTFQLQEFQSEIFELIFPPFHVHDLHSRVGAAANEAPASDLTRNCRDGQAKSFKRGDAFNNGEFRHAKINFHLPGSRTTHHWCIGRPVSDPRRSRIPRHWQRESPPIRRHAKRSGGEPSSLHSPAVKGPDIPTDIY